MQPIGGIRLITAWVRNIKFISHSAVLRVELGKGCSGDRRPSFTSNAFD